MADWLLDVRSLTRTLLVKLQHMLAVRLQHQSVLLLTEHQFVCYVLLALPRAVFRSFSDIPALLQDAPAGSLPFTGVLGLAALVWGLYQLRGPDRRGGDAQPREANTSRRPPAAHNLAQPPKHTQSSGAQAKACTQHSTLQS